MNEPTEIKTFPEWQHKYIVLNRWAYILGMAAMVAIGLAAGFAVGWSGFVIKSCR